jgi:hypothetical protein
MGNFLINVAAVLAIAKGFLLRSTYQLFGAIFCAHLLLFVHFCMNQSTG